MRFFGNWKNVAFLGGLSRLLQNYIEGSSKLVAIYQNNTWVGEQALGTPILWCAIHGQPLLAVIKFL